MSLRHRSVFVLTIGWLAAAGCGGGSTPPTQPTPTLTAVTVTGAGTPTVGDSAQLTATATFSDGSMQNVTAQATWESSNQTVVTISAAGMATFGAAGEADVKATYKTVSGSAHVTVAPRVLKFTLTGTVTDASNGQRVANVTVTIADGPDAGRSATSDSSGRYTISGVTAGSFTVSFSGGAYATKAVPVTVSSDTTLDVQLSTLPNVTRFYGLYNVSLTVLQQTCDFPFNVGPTGTFKIDGNTSGSAMTITINERGTTRVYTGSMRVDGSFNGVGGGVIAGFSPPVNAHEYKGTVSGTATGSRLDATEVVNFTIPCPGATMKIGYSGRK